MVTHLSCAEKLYLTKFLISSMEGSDLPPNAGIGLLTVKLFLTPLINV